MRKPDLILTKSDPVTNERLTLVLDVSIVADLEDAFRRTQRDKKQRYGRPPIRDGEGARADPEIVEYARKWTGDSNNQIMVHGLVWNWRGLVDPETALLLFKVLKLGKAIASTASIRILEKAQTIWRAWNDST